MLYANIDFKADIEKQRNNKSEQFFLNGGVSHFEFFGMLAWQPFQTMSFVCDFTLNSSYNVIVLPPIFKISKFPDFTYTLAQSVKK